MSRKRELASKIAVNSKITKKAALIAVETIFEDIKEKILNEEKFAIPGFFIITSKMTEAKICKRFTGKMRLVPPRLKLKINFTYPYRNKKTKAQ